MGETGDADEARSKCPICSDDYCTEHLVIAFADGFPHAGILENEWESVRRDLKVRLVEAWLEEKMKVDGPQGFTELLTFFSDFDRKEIIKSVAGELDQDDPGQWCEEVYDELGLEENIDLQVRIEQIMIGVIKNVDKTANVSHSYEKEPCVFSGNEIYASNPEAVVRRFRMVLGLT